MFKERKSMYINFSQRTQFGGIYIKDGGVEFVQREGGEQALLKLNQARQQFKDSAWLLHVGSDGYTLEAPNNKKIYSGPFSVKRLLKTGGNRQDTTKLVIRMDKDNRIKYSTLIPDKATLKKWYNLIKNKDGLEKMLNILSVLERRF